MDMSKFFFGIEEYCECFFHGDEENLGHFKWFINVDRIPLLNGFPLDSILENANEIFEIENEENYFDLVYQGNHRYFKSLDIKSYIINNYITKDYYQSVDDLYFYGMKFLFIIDCGDFCKISKITLSEKILNLVNNNYCKIVLNTSYEPYSIEKPEFLFNINLLADKYNLNRDNLKILSGNLISDNIISEKYEFIPYCYFLENPWFMEKDTHPYDNFASNRLYEIYTKIEDNRRKFLLNNREITKFERKILCYNRRAHTHRRLLFYHLYNDSLIWSNSFISLNNYDNNLLYSYFLEYATSQEESNNINNFYLNVHKDKNWIFDGKNLNINLADNFEEYHHKNTFVSLVSETYAKPNVVFFSEKIFKPIYACQPFIVSGNQYSLKKLKEFGFKTFDKWWDESYDDELFFIKRVEKIKEILRKISLMTDEELCVILRDMESVLDHNFRVFINYKNNHLNDSLSKIITENKKII